MSAEVTTRSDFRPHRFSTLSVPWLLSTSVHAALMLLFALSWPVARQQAPGARGVTLDVSLLSGSSTESEGLGTVALDTPPEDGYFEDDGPVLYAEESAAEAEVAGSLQAPSLESLLNEEPAVRDPGVLPPWAEAATGGGAPSGIASAASMTGQPAPSGRIKGGRALTGVFGIQGEGYKFIYVFDRSGSMDGHGGAPLLAAKAQLINSLADLGSTHQFQIIFYNEEPKIFEPGGRPGQLVFGTEQNKNLARRFVGHITASGATRHVEALQMALRLNPDVIFFLTDADEPRMTPRELADIAQMNHGTTINTIEFGTAPQPEPDNFIVRLARQNGGQHVYIDVSRLSSNRR